MSLDHHDVRSGLDVYTLDNAYLGSVVRVEPGPPRLDAPRLSSAETSPTSGEALGPMPTQAVGNSGPREQSAARAYATTGPSVGRPLGFGRLRVRLWLVGLDPRTFLPRSRWISLDLIQTVSLERVILRVSAAELDARPL